MKNNIVLIYPLITTIYLVLINCFVYGQDANFSASVNRTSVALNEQLQVTYKLEGSGSNFSLPRFDDFRILSGPNQSTSMQFINGTMSQSVSYSFVLQPLKEGTLRIPPATIEVNGKKISSNSLSVMITAPAAGVPQAGGGQGGTRNPDPTPDRDLSRQIADNVFMRIVANKTTVFRGEPLVVTFKLYTRFNLVNYGVTRIPALTGFWAEDISLPQQLQFENESLDGIVYRVAEVKKSVLFPQQSGSIIIEPMETEAIVRVQSRRGGSSGNSLFDQFFNDPFFGGYQDYKQKLSTAPLNITVKELPSSGQPDHFTGAVGRYTMTASLSPSLVEANEPVTLKITLAGNGNLKLLEGPRPLIPASLETYEPKITENKTVGAAGVRGTKNFEYLIIPRTPGKYTIDPLAFTFFDTEKKSYVTLRSEPFAFEATKPTGSPTTTSGVNRFKTDVDILGKDIMFIKTTTGRLRHPDRPVFHSWYFYLLAFVPLILLGTLIGYLKKRSELLGNAAASRIRQATRLANTRMAAAKKHIKANQRDRFYEETFNALWGYLSYKLAIPVADLSKGNAESELLSRGVPDTSILKIMQQINHCEYARYAPVTEEHDMQTVYINSVQAISELEGALKS